MPEASIVLVASDDAPVECTEAVSLSQASGPSDRSLHGAHAASMCSALSASDRDGSVSWNTFVGLVLLELRWRGSWTMLTSGLAPGDASRVPQPKQARESSERADMEHTTESTVAICQI